MRPTTKRMFNSNKQIEYAISAAIAVYIVFYTHPAPSFVSRMLSTSTLKVLALAGILFVGANHSVLIAGMLGLAMIMSIPAREHSKVISSSEKKILEEALKKVEKKDEMKPEKKSEKKPVKKDEMKKTIETNSEPIMKKPPRVITDAEKAKEKEKEKEKDEPSPLSSVSKMSSSSTSSGSEKFSLMNASPF